MVELTAAEPTEVPLLDDLEDDEEDWYWVLNEGGTGWEIYIGEDEGTNLELTYNWDQAEEYTKGNAWGHLALKVPDVYAASAYLKKQGVEFTKEPSPMKNGTRILAFIKDPDGYVIELNEPIS